MIDLPHTDVALLGEIVAPDSDAPIRATAFTRSPFPRLPTVFRVFPFEVWESQMLATVAAVRLIHLRLQKSELTNAVCFALANRLSLLGEFVPLTNHPDDWEPLFTLFSAFQQQWGDAETRFPIAVPDAYEPGELQKDRALFESILTLEDGLFDQIEVLAACEWNRTLVPAIVADHRYGSFFCIDYRTLDEQTWANDEGYMVIRGINRVRTQVPVWFLQHNDQRVDEWKAMGTNPVLTEPVERQWDWMLEALLEPDWPRSFQTDCKLQFSQKLSEACAATNGRGNAYYRGKID